MHCGQGSRRRGRHRFFGQDRGGRRRARWWPPRRSGGLAHEFRWQDRVL